MGIYGIASPGGGAGATTTALGLALTWGRPVLLVEADPGGRRVLPGFLADRLEGAAGPGLLGVAMEAQQDVVQAAPLLDSYSLPLGAGARLLHGIRDPRHARELAGAWGPLAEVLSEAGMDVIADLGRIGGVETPWPLLGAADVVVVVARSTLAGVDAARPRVKALCDLLHVPGRQGDPEAGGRAADDAGPAERLGLCLVEGPYRTGDVRRALGVPVWAELPDAPADARVLSDGVRPRVTFRSSVLMRSLARLGRRLRKQVDERAFIGAGPPVFGGGAR